MEETTNTSGSNVDNQINNFTLQTESYKLYEQDDEMAKWNKIENLIFKTSSPIIVFGGTFINILTFIVMQRGSLKEVSTCFYMSILAISDTGMSFIPSCADHDCSRAIHFSRCREMNQPSPLFRGPWTTFFRKYWFFTN